MDRFTEYMKLSKKELVEKVLQLENKIFSNDNIVVGGGGNNITNFVEGGGGSGSCVNYENMVIHNFGHKKLR